MENLKNITGIVSYLLETEPSTRNSDYELYYHVCKMMNPMTLCMEFGHVIRNRNKYGIPSLETVGRCRRKIVETRPDFAGCGDVEAQRTMNEEAFREFAKGVC